MNNISKQILCFTFFALAIQQGYAVGGKFTKKSNLVPKKTYFGKSNKKNTTKKKLNIKPKKNIQKLNDNISVKYLVDNFLKELFEIIIKKEERCEFYRKDENVNITFDIPQIKWKSKTFEIKFKQELASVINNILKSDFEEEETYCSEKFEEIFGGKAKKPNFLDQNVYRLFHSYINPIKENVEKITGNLIQDIENTKLFTILRKSIFSGIINIWKSKLYTELIIFNIKNDKDKLQKALIKHLKTIANENILKPIINELNVITKKHCPEKTSPLDEVMSLLNNFSL